MPQHARAFKENLINGDMLLDLDDSDLAELAVR